MESIDSGLVLKHVCVIGMSHARQHIRERGHCWSAGARVDRVITGHLRGKMLEEDR